MCKVLWIRKEYPVNRLGFFKTLPLFEWIIIYLITVEISFKGNEKKSKNLISSCRAIGATIEAVLC